MRITRNFMGKPFSVDIEDDKIPALLEKFLPSLSKYVNQLKEAGIDTSPILQSLFPKPAKAPASPALTLPPEGSVLDHTGAEIPIANITQLIKSELEKQQKSLSVPTSSNTIPRVCSNCLNRNAATGTFNVTNQQCQSCYTSPGLPNFRV